MNAKYYHYLPYNQRKDCCDAYNGLKYFGVCNLLDQSLDVESKPLQMLVGKVIS